MCRDAMKDPAMLFYTSDFLTGVSLMSMKERGQYITLLCLQQQRGHMTEKEMVKAVGKMSQELRSKFVEDDDGRLYNRRAEKEIKRREDHSKRQAKNIASRWQKDGSSGNTMVLPRNIPKGPSGNTTVIPSETETEIINNNINLKAIGGSRDYVGGKEEGGYRGEEHQGDDPDLADHSDGSDGFETFYAAYPRKSGYIDRAYREYLIAIDSGATLEEMLAALEWQRKEWGAQGGRYTPSAEKWLHNRGWTEKQPETDESPAAETDAEKLEHMRRMYASIAGGKERP